MPLGTETSSQEPTKPPVNNDLSDSEDEFTAETFVNTTEGDYRTRVLKYKKALEFPTRSAYQIGEEVYLYVSDQQDPSGPYIIIAVLTNEKYRIKAKNGAELPSPVMGHNLLEKA